MTPTLVVDLILGLLPFVVGYATFRLSSRQATASADAAGKAVDAAAFDRAKGIYLAAIKQLEGELRAVRQERDRLRDEATRLAGINDELADEVGQLKGVRGEVRRLQESNRQLRAQLAGDLES